MSQPPGDRPPPPERMPPTSDVKAEWKSGHQVAKEWAQERSESKLFSPNVPRVVLGLLVIGWGAFLLASFLPNHRPLSPDELAALAQKAGTEGQAWRFVPSWYSLARGLAILYMTLGVLLSVRGLMFHKTAIKHCGACGMEGEAELRLTGWRCTAGSHRVAGNWLFFVALFFFVAISVTLAISITQSIAADAEEDEFSQAQPTNPLSA